MTNSSNMDFANLVWSSSSVAAAAKFAAARMATYEGSHSFDHVLRVHGLALRLAKSANASIDFEILELGALLHDVFDSKMLARARAHMPENERCMTGAELLFKCLQEDCGVSDKTIASRVVAIADGISFSKQKAAGCCGERSLEMDYVQDADRIEALGAIGVGRAFAFGGHFGSKMEDTRNHYDEKMATLLPLFRTEAGRAVAVERGAFMEAFFQQYDRELAFAVCSSESEQSSKL